MDVHTLSSPVQKPVKKEFVNYIHHFRGVAILFVVACHLLLDWPEGSRTHRFLDLLWGNGTVLFVFIAGYLFQHLSKKFEYKTYLIKKLENVIVPYIIISIPIIIFRIVKSDFPGYILSHHADFASWPVLNKVIYFMFHGAHMQQLWFVPMISLFYLSAPVFIYIDRHPKFYYLLIPLAIVSLLVQREPFSDIIKMYMHFFSVYTFGMFMSRYKKEYLEFARKNWVIISFLTVAVFVLNIIFFNPYNNPINYLQKMLFCCFFIYWLWRLDKYVPKFLSVLADISFGLFFIHYYFILVIKAIYEKYAGHGIPGNIFYWTADLLLVLIGSIIAVKVTQRLFPKWSRNLIGC